MNTLQTPEINLALPIESLEETTMGNCPTTNHCVRYGCTGACEGSTSEIETTETVPEVQHTIVGENTQEQSPQLFTCCDRCNSEVFCKEEGSCQSTTRTGRTEGLISLLMPRLLGVSVQP